MQAKVHHQKTDSLEAEQFRAMVNSAPFQALRRRLEAQLERGRGDCETSVEPVNIHRAQGRVMALRTVLDLPDMILAEMAKK